MNESIHCGTCGEDCQLTRGHDQARGDFVRFERDEQICKVRDAPKGEGRQSELIKFALSDPIAQTCVFWQHVAQQCTVAAWSQDFLRRCGFEK